MLNFPVQVSVQTEYFQIKKHERKQKENYLAFFHPKERKKSNHSEEEKNTPTKDNHAKKREKNYYPI